MVLQAYRNGNGQWMCDADTVPGDCPNPATVQWSRCAPGNNDGAETVPVMACDTHKISGDLMAQVHQDFCTAPTTCNCTPFIIPSPAILRAGD